MNNQLTSPLLSSTKLRSSELDFVKGVLITLMVLFHLSYFVERHVALTEWVYTFHMSGFLVISGLLFNVEKDWHGFGRHCGALSFLMWCLRWCIWWRSRFPWWVYCAEFIVLPPPSCWKVLRSWVKFAVHRAVFSVFHGMYQAVCTSFCFRCFGHAVGVGQHDTSCRSLSPNGVSLRPNGAFWNSDGEGLSPY